VINHKQVLICTIRRCWRTIHLFEHKDHVLRVIDTLGDSLVTQGKSGLLLFEIVWHSNVTSGGKTRRPLCPNPSP
jgi:hypothetical protein